MSTKQEIIGEALEQPRILAVCLQASGRGKKFANVASLKDASETLCRFRDRGFGDGEAYGSRDFGRNCGDVYEDGKKIAEVSYNGRVWAV